MQVLIIIHDVYQEFNHFPLGAGYIAAVLEREGISAEVYCMDVFHYTNEELKEKLKANQYDIIGMGFMAARFTETVLPLSRIINKHKKSARFILGGAGASATPEYILRKTGADIIAIGESEYTIVDLIKGKDLHSINGIAYRQGDEIRIMPRRSRVGLNSLPLPAWRLFPMKEYIDNFKAPGMTDSDKMLSIVTSRGCVNRCNFCYRMESGIRVRCIQSVIDEIKMAVMLYGITYFFIVDELFVVNEKRVLDFERLLKENDLKIKYTVEARVDIFNRAIVESLKRSGCTYVNIGFESGSQKVLDEIGKNTTVQQNIRAMELCKDVGLPAGLNFIWGFENDTKESLFQNAELIKKYNQYQQLRTIRPVTPYPGSPLYYRAIELGLLGGAEDFYLKFRNSDLMTVNFTGIPDEACYDYLLQVNSELIYDHYRNTGQGNAGLLVKQFSDLYSGRITNFRGARTYAK